jgi:hypothetical protein
MKYKNYSPEQRQQHESFLKRVGAIASGVRTGRGPKAPPNHTAKSAKEKRYGRNKVKCERYRAQGRREARKALNEAAQAKKKRKAAAKRNA